MYIVSFWGLVTSWTACHSDNIYIILKYTIYSYKICDGLLIRSLLFYEGVSSMCHWQLFVLISKNNISDKDHSSWCCFKKIMISKKLKYSGYGSYASVVLMKNAGPTLYKCPDTI